MFGVMRALLHLQALKLISEQIVDRPVIEYRDRVVEKEKVEAVFMLRESLKQLTLLTSCTVQIVEKPGSCPSWLPITLPRSSGIASSLDRAGRRV